MKQEDQKLMKNLKKSESEKQLQAHQMMKKSNTCPQVTVIQVYNIHTFPSFLSHKNSKSHEYYFQRMDAM